MYTRWEKIKELGFGICAVALAFSTFGVFIIIIVQGAAYVYENIKWILYTETGLALTFTIFALERLIKDWRQL